MGLGILANGLLGLGIASAATSAAGTAASAALGAKQNDANLQAVRETNAANLQAVRETNAANTQQAELAYQRSLPINQIANMMQAGMSRPAALAALTGGGTYSAPALQTASADAPQTDYSQIVSALERATNIPANAMQFSLQGMQLESAKNNLLQQKEKHDLEMQHLKDTIQRERDAEMRAKYGQNVVEMTDKLANRILEIADNKGLSFEDYSEESKLVKDLDLNKEPLWRNAPDSARQRVRDILKQRADEFRARSAEERARIASDDSHRHALLSDALSRADLNEKQKSLIYKLELLANQVASGKLTIEQLQDEKVLRQSGFENKKEAAEAVAAAENLESQVRRDKARFKANRSDSTAAHIGYTLEWLVDNVNVLKGLR